jgi:hypothetical protein
MTLILNESDLQELYQQTPQSSAHNLVLDDFETFETLPEYLGQGYDRSMELSPGVWLSFSDCEYHQDLMVKTPAHNHLIQIMICLSGFLQSDIYSTFGGTCGYFSGSGVSPAYVVKHRGGKRFTCVNVEIEPALLNSFLTPEQRHSDTLRQLFKGEDWKVSFYPLVTPTMRSLAQQLWTAPYRGVAKRMYTLFG